MPLRFSRTTPRWGIFLPHVNGFASVVQEEKDLQRFIRACLRRVLGGPATELSVILQHQLDQEEVIIRLLRNRCSLLPHPLRFLAVFFNSPLELRSLLSPAIDRNRMLIQLIALHQKASRHIEALFSAHPATRRESLLREAVTMHGEMALALEDLSAETGPKAHGSTDASLQAPRTLSAAELAVQVWEGEGGAAHSA
jgi:hypothetical protein